MVEGYDPTELATGRDPVRLETGPGAGPPSLDAIRAMFPPTKGDAAFDPTLIEHLVKRLKTVPRVNTGHAFLDVSVKTGLAYKGTKESRNGL